MAINYKTVTYRTVDETNDNANYHWVELSSSHVPTVKGLVRRIAILCGTTSSGMTTDPIYLGIWERQDNGGLNFLGCSINAVTQEINEDSVWEFDGAIISGKPLVLGLLSNPDEQWNGSSELLLRSRVRRDDSDGCIIVTDVGNIRVTPDITFTIDVAEFIPDEEPEPEPEPEQEETHRVVDISKYWIQIIRDTNEFKQIAAAENPEFNGLLDAIYNALKDGFIHEATGYGVGRWEKLLGLIVKDGMTLEDRKTQILTHLSVKLPYTWRVLKQMITTCVGEDNYTMFIDNDTQTLHISLMSNVVSKTDEIKQLFKRVLPMNLVVEHGIPMDYTELEYLESSGEQNICVQAPNLITSFEKWTHEADIQFLSTNGARLGFIHRNGQSWGLDAQNRMTMVGTEERLNVDGSQRNVITYTVQQNVVDKDFRANCTLSVKGSQVTHNAYATLFTQSWKFGLFKCAEPYLPNDYSLVGAIRLYGCKCWSDSVEYDLVPVLDADGTPCMYDKVSHQCFYNEGKGKFGYKIKSTGKVADIEDLLTELEYLESSGTQWASLGKCPTYIGARAMLTCHNFANRFSLATASNEFAFFRCTGTLTETTVSMLGAVNNAQQTVWPLKEVVSRKIEIFQNWKMDGNALLKDPYSDWTYRHNNVFPSQLEQVDKNLWLFTFNGGSYNFIGKIYYVTISQREDIYMDLVPVLDANGTPCMFDKISRQCFYNKGTGTFGYRIKATGEESAPFSLRDPYYTAPSGIYARKVGENELEIVADTEEVQGEGWEQFANTAEAYEQFNIKEVNEND